MEVLQSRVHQGQLNSILSIISNMYVVAIVKTFLLNTQQFLLNCIYQDKVQNEKGIKNSRLNYSKVPSSSKFCMFQHSHNKMNRSFCQQEPHDDWGTVQRKDASPMEVAQNKIANQQLKPSKLQFLTTKLKQTYV